MSDEAREQTVLTMDPSRFPPETRSLYERLSARRTAHGENFGGPYLALFNHPDLARRVEELGFYLKFEGALPRPVYQFDVLSVARATGAAFEWKDHLQHALDAGLSHDVVDAVGSGRTEGLPPPFALAHEILTKTLAWHALPLELQARAAAEWGDRGLVEIVVLSGFYQMFAAINAGFDIR